MRNFMAWVAGIFVLFWMMHDPAGAANTVVTIVHALGVVAGSLTQHFSASKPALPAFLTLQPEK